MVAKAFEDRGLRRVFWNSSCDVEGLIADRSSCRLMLDDHVISDINCDQWAGTICLSISRSFRQKVCFLGWPVGDFEAFNDDPIILMEDP